MAHSAPWALGIDVGNAKLKLFAMDAQGASRSFATALPWSGQSPYARESDFQVGINEGLAAILADRESPPGAAVAVISNGYSYSTHKQAARHTLKLLAELLPQSEVRGLAWNGELLTPHARESELGLLASTNGAGALHLALRINWPGRVNGLVVDAGGTTTAVTPIVNGRIDPAALKRPSRHLDHRARNGKLVWIGSRTTPVESLLQAVSLRGAQYPIIPRGVTMHEVMALLGLLPKARERRLRLFHAAPKKAHLFRAMADSIGVDPSLVPRRDLIALAKLYLNAAIENLARAVKAALSTATRSKEHVLIFGLGARGLALPALVRAGVARKAITFAEELLSPELSDLASCYGACHAALELTLGRPLAADFGARPKP